MRFRADRLEGRLILDDKTILVTGGTGSFGTRFIERALSDHEPRAIRVFSRDELKQYEMQRRFGDEDRLRFFIGDVRDRDRLRASHARRRRDRPRRGAQAGAGLRVQPVRGGADQRHRRRERGRGGDRERRAARRSRCRRTRRSTRSTSTARPSCARRSSSPRATPTPADSLARFAIGALRQRRRQPRQRDPALPGAGRRRALVTITDERMTRFWITLDAGRRLRDRRLSSGWAAARSSCRRSRRCGSSTWPRRWRPSCERRMVRASVPARSCTRCCSPRTSRATRAETRQTAT